MPLTHYEILGLTPKATTEEIRRAYRRQALHWHPDRNPNNPKAHRRFIAIKDAYAVLSNPERRAFYDEVLREREAAKHSPPPFQYGYPPPRQQQRQSYPPPPQYRPVYRERPSSRSWSGIGAAFIVFMLFRFLSMCNQKQYDVDYEPLRLEGLEYRNTSMKIDSILRAAGEMSPHETASDSTFKAP